MLIFRHPQQIRQQVKQEKNAPKPVPMTGAGFQGGLLNSFAEAATSGMANGR